MSAASSNRPIVFTGPSASPVELSHVLPQATILPPIARDDLYRAREQGGSVFLIIDGLFSHQFAVSPREIVDVVRDGAVVLGASSMGALRAAECWPAGMRGIGLVYRLYRAGVLESDDEVAVATNPDRGFAAMSVALINVRYAASKAARMGLIGRGEARNVVQAAQDLFFTDRQWPAILNRARIRNHVFAAYCERTNAKRNDATAAAAELARIGALVGAPATGRLFERPARYPGHSRTLGFTGELLRQQLVEWLFGSGRYQKFIWALVAGEPEFNEIHASAEDRAPVLREHLAEAIFRLLDQPERVAERLWRELDFVDELDAELLRWFAVREYAAAADLQGCSASLAATKRVREEAAIAHGFRNWSTLREDVSDSRLFGAIPMVWIEQACAALALARSFARQIWQTPVLDDKVSLV